MLTFQLLNLLSHVISCAPGVVLLQQKMVYEFILFIAVLPVTLVHGLLPVSHVTLTRQIDNAMVCLLIAIVMTLYHDIAVIKLSLPVFSVTIYVGLSLVWLNQDLAGVLTQTLVVTFTGILYIWHQKAVPRLKSPVKLAAILVWFASNMVYLIAYTDEYMEVVHRSITSLAFCVLVSEVTSCDIKLC